MLFGSPSRTSFASREGGRGGHGLTDGLETRALQRRPALAERGESTHRFRTIDRKRDRQESMTVFAEEARWVVCLGAGEKKKGKFRTRGGESLSNEIPCDTVGLGVRNWEDV